MKTMRSFYDFLVEKIHHPLDDVQEVAKQITGWFQGNHMRYGRTEESLLDLINVFQALKNELHYHPPATKLYRAIVSTEDWNVGDIVTVKMGKKEIRSWTNTMDNAEQFWLDVGQMAYDEHDGYIIEKVVQGKDILFSWEIMEDYDIWLYERRNDLLHPMDYGYYRLKPWEIQREFVVYTPRDFTAKVVKQLE